MNRFTHTARRIGLAVVVFTLLACTVLFLSSCQQVGNALQDGYYTAEMAEYDDKGWKEYVTIGISGGEIVTVEFNAKNASGLIKAWDMAYMSRMNDKVGTYPTRYTRAYAASLIRTQTPNQIDAVAGATVSGWNFSSLISAALENSKTGNRAVALV